MFLNDDDMVECPYNKSHRMLRKRLQSHLLKCRLSYPDVELRKCPFNITHLVPEPEFTHHATNCPDRKLITQYKYDAPVIREEEGPKHAPIECDEDWDDTDVADYNPQLYVENANVIRKPEGSNPSCRKIFIKQERKRLGDVDDEEDDDTDTKNNIAIIPSSSLNEKEENNCSDDDIPNINKSLKNCYKYATTNQSSRSRWNCASSSTDLSHERSASSLASSSKRRSRSPNNRSNKDRSRSPVNRSYRDRSPLRGSPDYSLRYSPPPSAISRTLGAYNPDDDPYYNGGSTRNSSNSREAYYRTNRYGSEAYYNRSSEANAAQPHQAPPPMISYPAPRSNLTRHPPNF